MDSYYGAIVLVVLIVLVMYANRDAPGNKNPGKVVTGPDDMAFREDTLTRGQLTQRWDALQVQIRNTKTSKPGALVDGPITMTSPTTAYFGKFTANWEGSSWSVISQ